MSNTVILDLIRDLLNGLDGEDGKSAYEIYVEHTDDDPIKSEEEWLDSLKGEPGAKGDRGPTGPSGDRGAKGDQGPRGEQGEPGDKGDQGPRGEQGERGAKGDQGPQGKPGSTSNITVELPVPKYKLGVDITRPYVIGIGGREMGIITPDGVRCSIDGLVRLNVVANKTNTGNIDILIDSKLQIAWVPRGHTLDSTPVFISPNYKRVKNRDNHNSRDLAPLIDLRTNGGNNRYEVLPSESHMRAPPPGGSSAVNHPYPTNLNTGPNAKTIIQFHDGPQDDDTGMIGKTQYLFDNTRNVRQRYPSGKFTLGNGLAFAANYNHLVDYEVGFIWIKAVDVTVEDSDGKKVIDIRGANSSGLAHNYRIHNTEMDLTSQTEFTRLKENRIEFHTYPGINIHLSKYDKKRPSPSTRPIGSPADGNPTAYENETGLDHPDEDYIEWTDNIKVMKDGKITVDDEEIYIVPGAPTMITDDIVRLSDGTMGTVTYEEHDINIGDLVRLQMDSNDEHHIIPIIDLNDAPSADGVIVDIVDDNATIAIAGLVDIDPKFYGHTPPTWVLISKDTTYTYLIR